MKLHFYNRKGLTPSLIKYFGGGDFNHVSIEVHGFVYETIGGKLLGADGVVMSPDKLTQHQENYAPDKLVTINIKSEFDHNVEAFLRSKVGKKYGYKEILGFVFRWIRGTDHQYYCSELAVRAYEIATSKKYDLKYSPSALYELAK